MVRECYLIWRDLHLTVADREEFISHQKSFFEQILFDVARSSGLWCVSVFVCVHVCVCVCVCVVL